MWLGPSDYVRTRVKGLAPPGTFMFESSSLFCVSATASTTSREQPKAILLQMGLKPDGKDLQFAEDFARAVAFAEAGQISLQR
jgi:hypothetical protein